MTTPPTHRFKADLTGDNVINVNDLMLWLENMPGSTVTLTSILSQWNKTNPAGRWAHRLVDVFEPEPSHDVIHGLTFDGLDLSNVQKKTFNNCTFTPYSLTQNQWLVMTNSDTSDIVFNNCSFRGDGDTKIGFDAYRGPARIRLVDCVITGCQYGAYLSGVDLEVIGCVMRSSRSEHGIRVANADRVNLIDSEFIRSSKTACTIRRFVNDCAVVSCDMQGQLSIGPDPRWNSAIDWATNRVGVYDCRVTTSGDNPDRPVVIWPHTNDWTVQDCSFNDPENAAKGRGFLLQKDQIECAQGFRQYGYGMVKNNTYNGSPSGWVNGPGINIQ